MFALKALVQDDVEERTFKSYTADCLGTIVKSFGGGDKFPLFSELIEGKSIKEELSPQEVVEHVKKLFS